jgi:hypothetical protein
MIYTIEQIEQELDIVLNGVRSHGKSVKWAKLKILSIFREREDFFSNRIKKMFNLLEEVEKK